MDGVNAGGFLEEEVPEALQWLGREWARKKGGGGVGMGSEPQHVHSRKEGTPLPPPELELFPRGGGGMEVVWGTSC